MRYSKAVCAREGTRPYFPYFFLFSGNNNKCQEINRCMYFHPSFGYAWSECLESLIQQQTETMHNSGYWIDITSATEHEVHMLAEVRSMQIFPEWLSTLTQKTRKDAWPPPPYGSGYLIEHVAREMRRLSQLLFCVLSRFVTVQCQSSRQHWTSMCGHIPSIYRIGMFIFYFSVDMPTTGQLIDKRWFTQLHRGRFAQSRRVQERIDAMRDKMVITPHWTHYAVLDCILHSFLPEVENMERQVKRLTEWTLLPTSSGHQPDEVSYQILLFTRQVDANTRILTIFAKQIQHFSRWRRRHHKSKSKEKVKLLYPHLELYLLDLQGNVTISSILSTFPTFN